MDYTKLFNMAPYSLNKKDKEAFLSPFLTNLTRYHYDNCSEYKKMMDGIGFEYNKAYNFTDLPFLPVRL